MTVEKHTDTKNQRRAFFLCVSAHGTALDTVRQSTTTHCGLRVLQGPPGNFSNMLSHPLNIEPNLIAVRLLIDPSYSSCNFFIVIAFQKHECPHQVLWLWSESSILKPATLVQFAPCDGYKNRLCSKPRDESALASLKTSTALLPPHEAKANVFDMDRIDGLR